MDKLLEQVKEALVKNAPSPWKPNDHADMEIITQYPTWLKQLIEMIEGLQRENERLYASRKIIAEDHADIVEERNDLIDKLKIAEEALEWYAKQGNYAERKVNAEFGFYDIEKPMALNDRGRKAGEALSRIREGEMGGNV